MNRKYVMYAIIGTVWIGTVYLFGASIVLASQSPPDPIPSPIEVIETGKSAWSAFTAGKWVLGLGLALTLIIQLFRAPWLGGIAEKIPARWRVFIPMALSGLASALLSLAGELEPEVAALLAPAMAGVAIGTHELGEAVFRRRVHYRGNKAGLLSIVLGVFLIGGCALRPPIEPPGALMKNTAEQIERFDWAATEDGAKHLAWCRTRQERRWWSSALAQAAGVLAGGLAASALARDDDRIELGLEIGGLISASFAAGAQTYSGAQSSAYEQYCSEVGLR